MLRVDAKCLVPSKMYGHNRTQKRGKKKRRKKKENKLRILIEV